MSKQTKENISPLHDILEQLDQWSKDTHNSYLLTAISTDDQDSYTTLSSAKGPKAHILAAIQDLIQQYPSIADILSIALHKNQREPMFFS